MARLLLLILATVILFGQTLAFNCSIPPIYVDIHKRAVHGTDVFQYGSFIGVGELAQNQSLWPSLSRNETTVADVNFCNNSTLANCAQSTRGNFDPSLSTTWIKTSSYVSTDISDTNTNASSIFGRDDIHLYTHYFETDGASQTLLSNYTFEDVTSGSQAPGIVGLGLSSTLLQGLYDNGLIAGRTYSLYIGSGMDRAGGVINGSNTFGGYDAGRFTGEVHNYSMQINDPNPLSVRVADIILNEPNGLTRNVSLFDPTAFPNLKTKPSPFEARITTDQYPLSFPFEITQNYISTLAAAPSGNPDGSLKLTKPFNGTMTIILDDGFSIALPSEVMYNVSGISPVAARDENSTEPFFLSVAWLSQVYLMMNYDAYMFHLAQALPEANYVLPTIFCPRSTPAAYAPPSRSVIDRAQLVGAILGGVIGGLGVICFTIGLCVLWRRQRREKAQEKARSKAKMAQFEVQDSGSDSSVRVSKKGKKTKWHWRR